ncbi:MAG TPA: imidazole glycerol phosphate synthase subunit HisH [Bacillota bacterium]
MISTSDRLRIAIIDYEAGNLHSVAGALARAASVHGLSCELELVRSAAQWPDAEAAVLPGVGAFGSAMERLAERGLVERLRDHAAAGRPLLGICLGMQVLFDRGLEDGEHAGLGLLKGTVALLPDDVKRPHMGWNHVEPLVDDPWLPYGRDPFYAYFAHSYAAPVDAEGVIAACHYGSATFAAAVRKGAVLGVQFHPERSHKAGLALLGRWLSRLAAGVVSRP